MILENLVTELPTTREVLADGRVRYSTVVVLAPGEINLYSLKLNDIEPAAVGEITLSIPIVRGGETVVFDVDITDNTRIVNVLCPHTLPDGRVIVVELERVEGTTNFRGTFTPPADAPSGEVEIEIVVTDLGGNVTTVDATGSGGPVTLLLDNDAPARSPCRRSRS